MRRILLPLALLALAAPSARAAATTPPEGIVLEDLTNPSGAVSTTASGSWVKPAKNAFDNGTKHNNDDRSICGGTTVDWIYTFDEPTKVNAYKVFTPGSGTYSYNTRMPRTWTFEAKNSTDAAWTVLDTQSNETGWTALESRYYEFRNNTAYDSYRFAVTANQSGADSYVQIDELEFFFVNRGNPELGTVSLVRTGAAAYSVSATESMNTADLFWIADNGTAATTNLMRAAVAEGSSVTDAVSGLAANTTYRISVLSTNAAGKAEAVAGTLYTGTLSLGATTDANENGPVAGTVAVSRSSADPWPLTVNYTIASADAGAAEGTTWAAPSAVSIAGGAETGFLLVTPLVDPSVTEDVEVAVALAAGNYEIPAANEATLDILNLTAPAGFNTWISPSNSLASIDCNWSEGHSPTASEHVRFDGRLSTSDCTWDDAASATVASWTQTNGYTGVVTLQTVYPGKGDFQCLAIEGDMTIDSGTITHPLSLKSTSGTWLTGTQIREQEVYRLCLHVGGTLTVGARGAIDVKDKGHYQALSRDCYGAHAVGYSSLGGAAAYGNPKEPIDVGMGCNGNQWAWVSYPGSGAIRITAGDVVVNGSICANAGSVSYGSHRRFTAAAGSIWIDADSITGSGSITAVAVKPPDGNCGGNGRGSGGSIALWTKAPVALGSPFVSADAAASGLNAPGTVFLHDQDMDKGVLVIDGMRSGDPLDYRACVNVTTDGDWTFDEVRLQNYGALSVPVGTTLALPGGWAGITSTNAVSAANPGVLRYEGGTLDFGSASDVTLSGCWAFAPISNYVFNANVTLADGAKIGFGGAHAQGISQNSYPVNVNRIHCTVNGNLTIPSGCSVDVNKSGAMQNSNGVPADYPLGAHGGRRSNTMKTIGSVFHPRTLPHGQSNSYAHIIPGGAVELVVTGTLTLDGTVTSTGYTGGDGINSSVGGGSIDVSAGRLVGTGSIKAGAVKNGQPGGRIAIRLTGADATLGDFEGTIDCATMGNGSVGSCGSIYVQSPSNGEGRGIVIFDDNNVTCTTYTPICATGYEADDVADFRYADLVVRNQAKAQATAADANGTFRMDDIEVGETGELDLFGKQFVVTSAKIGGRNVHAGTYTAAQLAALGFAGVVDTADGADGTLRVLGQATVIIIK